VDEDCDGMYQWYQDSDGDGYGSTTVVQSANTSPGSGESNNSTDCNDNNAAVNPGATKVCDGIDNDCVGGIDDDAVDSSIFYIDADNDSYGDASVFVQACSAPAGYVTDNTDCDDTDDTIYPGVTEIAGNGIDENCDGVDAPLIPEYINDFSTYPGTGWTEATGSYGNPSGIVSDWTSDDYGNDVVHANGQSAKINIVSATLDEYLISPLFDLSGSNYYLNFDIALTAFDNQNPTSMGIDDYVALLLTEDGSTWTELTRWDSGSTIAASRQPSGEITLSGYGANVKFAFYAFSDTANENNDFFIDNFQITSAPLSLGDNSIEGFSLYPNPTKGMLYINGDVNKLKSVEIYSITGQYVMQVTNNFRAIDISDLDSALYFVILNTLESSKVFKIVRE